MVDHIPEPSQQTVRYWGFYANAARGKRRKAAQGDNAIETPTCRDDDDEFTRRARLTWAKLIRRVYEVDPLLCPFCGAEMKILAFILDFGAAKAIRKKPQTPGPGVRAAGPRASGDVRAHRRIRLSLRVPAPTHRSWDTCVCCQAQAAIS